MQPAYDCPLHLLLLITLQVTLTAFDGEDGSRLPPARFQRSPRTMVFPIPSFTSYLILSQCCPLLTCHLPGNMSTR